MPESTYIPGVALPASITAASPRHSATVRITHWITAFAFLGFLISGSAILISHPRLYWGETGSLETPSLIDLPLPFIVEGQNAWARSLHFLSGWVCVLTGVYYVISGFLSGHFRQRLVPARADLAWTQLKPVLARHLRFNRPSPTEAFSYNTLQRIAYLGVIFVLTPFLLWTGLAMSPAITSVFPSLVNLLGGQQSARTLHFFAAILAILFLTIHLAMVFRAGFRRRTGPMITGRPAPKERL